MLLRAASGGPGLLVPPARSKIKATHAGPYRRTHNIVILLAAPVSLAIQASGNTTFIKVKPHAIRTDTYRRSCLSDINKKHEIPPHSKHPRLKKHFFSSRNPMYLLAATINAKGDISGMPSMQPTAQICTSPPGLRVSEHMPRRHSCVCLPECSVSRAMATGALEAWKSC